MPVKPAKRLISIMLSFIFYKSINNAILFFFKLFSRLLNPLFPLFLGRSAPLFPPPVWALLPLSSWTPTPTPTPTSMSALFRRCPCCQRRAAIRRAALFFGCIARSLIHPVVVMPTHLGTLPVL